MIDLFTLALTHGLILLALCRLLPREELDSEEPTRAPKPWLKRAQGAVDEEPGGA